MKPLLSFLFIALFTTASAQKVFTTDWKIAADLTVFITNEKAKADLIVYKTNDALEASGNNGIWKFVTVKSLSEKRIYFSLNETECDIKIFFTNDLRQAGWINENKKILLDRK